MNQHPCERIYIRFNYPGFVEGSKTLLTGIREDDENNMYITGWYEPDGSSSNVISFLYKGDLRGTTGPCSTNSWNILNYPGRNVLVTNLYGPLILKNGNIRVVGNYVVDGNEKSAIGCMYEGNINGKGKWKTLIPTNDTLNTIAHSTMGDLVVGNYDTKLIQGKAFIYNIKNNTYYNIVKNGAKSITAYGVWHNGSESYIICGGFSDLDRGIDVGYIVNWDNRTKRLFNWREYHYNNDIRSIVTHFDGITSDGKEGYNLTGDAVELPNTNPIAFFAHISNDEAKWEKIEFYGSSTSGNSISGTKVIGVYEGSETVNGYISITL